MSMVKADDIERAVASLLLAQGFSVISAESVEGSGRPAVTVEVLLETADKQSDFMEEDSFSVSIIYYPQIESHEEIIRVSQQMKKMFTTAHLEVCGRMLCAESIQFDKEGSLLFADLIYKITAVPETPFEECENAEELDFSIGRFV
ncbi:MAG: hypothetical protein IJA16_02985 [Clostridia bacterium]|nr:hypothetical protein [Clostridia bacterium]